MRLALICSGVLLLAAGLFPPTTAASEIPTEHFFQDREFINMKVSPDGEHVAFTFQEGSERRLGIMNLEEEGISATFGLGENQHVFDFWFASDTRVVMSIGEVTGNLDTMSRPMNLYAGNVDGSRRQEIFSSDQGGFQVLHPLHDNSEEIIIARHIWRLGEPRRDPGINRLNVYDGETRHIGNRPPGNHVRSVLVDNDGEIRVAVEMIQGDDFDDRELNLLFRDEDGWEQLELDSQRPNPTMSMLGFSANNRRAYFLSNHDMAENDRMGVFRYDFDTGQVDKIFRHDNVDVSGGIIGQHGEVIGATARFGPKNYHLFEDAEDDGAFLQGLVAAFEDMDVDITSYTRDGSHAIVQASSDRNPGGFFLFDVESREARFLAAANSNLEPDDLVETIPILIEARDGLELHALLTLPEGQRSNVPLIVNVHGGPFGVTDHWQFQPEAQFFANRGYATLQVNFRGSGNRGDDFRDAGRQEWGGKMQDDVTDATRWAINAGVADEDRICIYGGSYGGYASLMGVIREPELYKCAVGYVGVYDLPWLRSGDGSDFSVQRSYGREGRAAFERFMSSHVGPDPEELKDVSPVHNVEKIEAELFIVHGGADVRVVIGHAERLRDALDEIDKDYQWMVKDDEGHGFFDEDNRVELYTQMLEFFETHIGPEAGEASEDD